MKVREYIIMLENKLGIALEYIEDISNINAMYVKELPEEYKNRFILASNIFLVKYKEFLEVDDGEEES